MGTVSYRFRGCELPAEDGRTMTVDGCAIIYGCETWKVVSLSVDGQPALCEDCRARIKLWLHAPINAAVIGNALRTRGDPRMKIVEFDIGNTVQCDGCGEDYTDSDAIGGVLFGSKGYCPKCAPRLLEDAKKYGEEQYIRDRARNFETFRDFIMRIRGGNNKVRITGPGHDADGIEKWADDTANQLGVKR